jgi:pyrroloquinoline quinone (PQQ) biosynthesis protein C
MQRISARTATIALALLLAASGAFASGGTVADPTPRARRLIAEIRNELRPVEDQIRSAPFLSALERGQVPRSGLRAFAGDQFNILRTDLRSDAHMVTRFGSTPGGPFFLNLVNGEAIAVGLMRDFATALGMSENDLLAYEPRPGAQTYPSYAASLAFYASDAEIAAAFLVNFAVFGENCGRMAAALRSRYGFTPAQTAFFDFFASSDPAFEPAALAIVEAGLNAGVSPRAIRRACRLLQAYEKDFWYTVGEN